MKRYIFNLILLLTITVLFSTQTQGQEKGTEIHGKILDEAGNPIPNAKVYFNSGSKIVYSDINGTFTINMLLSETAVLEAVDFETIRLDGVALNKSAVKMIKKAYGLKSTDKVTVPFGTLYSRQLTGAVTVIKPKETMKYDKTENVKSVLNGRVPGMFGTSNLRSNTDIYTGALNEGGNMVTVIDGIPRVGYNLNLSEVESISVLKDITTRALYGAQAMDGVILITTKRGEAYKREMNVSVERGISKPISLPKFLNSAEYMGYYNQALKNDGLPEKYSADAISKTASGTDKLRYPDEDYYNSTYLKNMGNFTNVIGEVSGGNSNAQYYLNMGWTNTTDLMQKLWKEKYTDGSNTFNLRGNVDYQINSFMKMKIDGVVFYSNSNTPRFNDQGTVAQNFYMRASSFLPNYYPALIDASLLTPDQLGAAKLIDNKYVLGGTSEYQTNIYGEMATNGYNSLTNRILQNNTSLDFDLKGITQGLTAKAYLTFDMNNYFLKSLARTYAVYQPTYTIPVGQTAEVLSLTKYGVDKPAETPNVTDVGFYRRVSVSGQVNYDREFNNMHKINATGIAYTDFQTISGQLQNEKSLNFAIRTNYMYKDKYIAELSIVTSGSTKLDANKWGTSPSLGLAWVLSEESFLKGNEMINYLKLRANAGKLKTDQYSVYRQYMSYYTGGTNADNYNYNFAAFRNSQRTINAGNPNISWTEKQEMSLGFESVLIKGKLQFEATYFNNKLSGMPMQLTNIIPGYVEQIWQNYGEYNDKGIEWGLKYNAKIGKALLTIGHNAIYSTPTKVKDNVIDYAEPWRKRTGIVADAIFGLISDGFYTSGDFNNGSLASGLPTSIFGEVKPGDIKYIDQNNDGMISDKDEKMIGNSSPRLQYALDLNLKVGDFELFLLGTGQYGAERIYNKAYDWVYGDRKYSEVVRNSWTESTATTATYPRLSSNNSPNNFRNSTFWLKKDNFFTLQTAQLTYNMPVNTAQKITMKAMQLYVRGSNLFTISENKERRQLNPDSQLQMRYYSVGVVASF